MLASHIYKNSGFVSDPNFNNVSLLLHGDGTNGAQNNTFLDSSSNNFTITRNGTPTQGSFSPFGLNGEYSISANGGSGYFDGSGDYLSFPEITFNGNFCAEAWVYRIQNSASYSAIFGGSSIDPNINNHQFYITNTGGVSMVLADTVIISDAGNSVINNQWNHIAWVRDGSNCAIFVNGIRQGTGTTSINTSICSRIAALTTGSAQYSLNGYISNARIVIGNSVYDPSQTTISVPTSPLTAIANTSLLCSFTNAGIFDNAAKNNLITVGTARISDIQKKFGSGSMYFAGTGNYLTLPGGSSFDLGSQDFTIECWFNGTGANVAGIFVRGTSTIGRYTLSLDGAGRCVFWINEYGVVGPICTGNISITDNQWHHLAIVRNNNFFTVYTDGVGGTSVNSSVSISNSIQPASIGTDIFQTSRVITGYIDDFRITKGIARYTANFTPPTQAFPNL